MSKHRLFIKVKCPRCKSVSHVELTDNIDYIIEKIHNNENVVISFYCYLCDVKIFNVLVGNKDYEFKWFLSGIDNKLYSHMNNVMTLIKLNDDKIVECDVI